MLAGLRDGRNRADDTRRVADHEARVSGSAPLGRPRRASRQGMGLGLLVAALLGVGSAGVDVAGAQRPAGIERPLPHPIRPLPGYVAAVEAGTRSETGAPGPAYWQNSASYVLNARLLPDAKRLEGTARITFHNASPDTLTNLHLELTQNFHAPGAARDEQAEVTGGIELRRLTVAGRTLTTGTSGPRYQVFGARLVILPPTPVAPGTSVDLEIDYAFNIPQAGIGERMGWSGDDLFFIAYWYPQMTVYDDVVGWHPDIFTGTTEFYSNFADYDVTIEAPAGWVVMGTGEMVEPERSLAPEVLERWRAAAASDEPVRVWSAGDPSPTVAGENGVVRWRFTASSVRDVAFSATRASNWDALRTPVGDRDGDGATDYTVINSFWRPSAPLWSEVARYAAHSIDFLSRYTGLPYPWPHMTAVEGEGIIGGGMEFPMMTLMGPYTANGAQALYAVTAHELAHMWVPMQVASDERRYSWLDEGLTTFNENQSKTEYFPGIDHDLADMRTYLTWAATGNEGEIMRLSAHHYNSNAYAIASYMKPATAMVALRAVLGEDVFLQAYRTFLAEWRFKHPYPWDMWSTFERVSGRDLDWFWSGWYYETWTMDHAVESVTAGSGGTTVTIRDEGDLIMPVHLRVTFADGATEDHVIPVDDWLAGRRTATLTLPAGRAVARVEIDPDLDFPDIDRDDNVWVAP